MRVRKSPRSPSMYTELPPPVVVVVRREPCRRPRTFLSRPRHRDSPPIPQQFFFLYLFTINSSVVYICRWYPPHQCLYKCCSMREDISTVCARPSDYRNVIIYRRVSVYLQVVISTLRVTAVLTAIVTRFVNQKIRARRGIVGGCCLAVRFGFSAIRRFRPRASLYKYTNYLLSRL